VQAGAPGLYSGAVVATPATGPAERVPLGLFKEPERYDLTLNAVGRDGQPATFADAGVMNVDDGELARRPRRPHELLNPGYVTGVQGVASAGPIGGAQEATWAAWSST
jgi:hypothetical protein